MREGITFESLAVGVLETKFPGLKKKGLKKELRVYLKKYLHHYFDSDDCREYFDKEFTIHDCVEGSIEDLLRDMHFIPDAYRILEDDKEIQLFEVEDTHPISLNKLNLLAKTWLGFSETGIQLSLFVTDRYGSSIRKLDLDLFERLLHDPK